MPAAVVLFDGLPVAWSIYFTLAFAVVLAMFIWTVVLFVRAARAERLAARERSEVSTSDFHWVFLVPALNEEVTIRDSVERLLSVPVERRLIVVIDDGSDDATPDVLAGIDAPDLLVVRRDPPDARKGKAAALNHAYQLLDRHLGDSDRAEVIVAVIDADGRLDRHAPRHVAPHFDDSTVGGVQCLVRIYNRRRLLAWFQDVEFNVYGHLFQTGRNGWGTAGMGGNGQFNRLSALDDIAEGPGPWRDRLTEDQDLGLRLVMRNWKGHQEVRATVDQQGLSKLRPLLRQRTRWSQGNLQAMELIPRLWQSALPRGARVELLTYLLMPLWQSIVGVAAVAALVFWATGAAPLWSGGPTWLLFGVYLLAFGGTVLGCIAGRRRLGVRGWLVGAAIGHAYSLYTWLLWPVLLRSTARHLRGDGSWAKTNREPIDADLTTADAS